MGAQNSFFYGTILWVKLFCFISYFSVAQEDTSVVLKTIQISSIQISDKTKIERLFNTWQNTPIYNGVYKVNNIHTQQNSSEEIEQLFLLQSLFSVKDFKENIFSTASSLVASQPIPQMVSVGYKIRPPFSKTLKQASISALNRGVTQANYKLLTRI